MRDAFVQKLLELAARDERIFLITADLGFGVLNEYVERFPQQFLNIGVAEQNMTGVATGLALEGRVVFTYSLGNFPSMRCLEQIRNDACYHDANVKIVTVGGGLSYGALGMSHHATEDIAIMRSLPGVTVVAPGCDWEAAGATQAAVETAGVCYLRFDKTTAGNTARDGEVFSHGAGRVLRQGSDVALIVTGGILKSALEAVTRLEVEGIDAMLISMPYVKPLDVDLIRSAATETGGIVTVEEHTVLGGLGGAVAEYCLESGFIPKRFRRIGLKDTFTTVVGSQDYLRQHYEMDQQAIYRAAKQILQ